MESWDNSSSNVNQYSKAVFARPFNSDIFCNPVSTLYYITSYPFLYLSISFIYFRGQSPYIIYIYRYVNLVPCRSSLGADCCLLVSLALSAIKPSCQIGHLRFKSTFTVCLEERWVFDGFLPPYAMNPDPFRPNETHGQAFPATRQCWQGIIYKLWGWYNSRRHWGAWRCRTAGCPFEYRFPIDVIPGSSVMGDAGYGFQGHEVAQDKILEPEIQVGNTGCTVNASISSKSISSKTMSSPNSSQTMSSTAPLLGPTSSSADCRRMFTGYPRRPH